jgi:putative YphP/YqiW family bacilliredoxin
MQEGYMPYSELMVAPMRQDLVRLGFKEMRTADDVEGLLESSGTVLVAVNSVCGCSAGGMRPAVALALEHGPKPDLLTTVFAGQEIEATEKAREYFVGYPPSSPSVALLRDGELVYMMERHQIEGHTPQEISESLRAALEEHCR